MKARRFLVHGIVQGVGFRFFVMRAARALGLRGYVRNLNDGGVEAVAHGPEDALEDLAVQIRRGPAGAHVSGVEITDLPPADPADPGTFEIRH